MLKRRSFVGADQVGLDHQQTDEVALRVDFQGVDDVQDDAGDIVMQQFERADAERDR